MKYTAIFKLKEMLEEANIPFEFTDDLFNVKEKIDAGEHIPYPPIYTRHIE